MSDNNISKIAKFNLSQNKVKSSSNVEAKTKKEAIANIKKERASSLPKDLYEPTELAKKHPKYKYGVDISQEELSGYMDLLQNSKEIDDQVELFAKSWEKEVKENLEAGEYGDKAQSKEFLDSIKPFVKS